jgi:1-deoxy-D-xylulose-5-phosphate reductoisomerase
LNSRKRICILGSTGSIGEKALRVVGDYPDRFEVVGLAARSSAERLAEQAAEWGVRWACLTDAAGSAPSIGGARMFVGEAGMIDLLDACQPDLVVVATVGYAGLAPTLHAIQSGATVALANKEVLVTAGTLVMGEAARRGVAILPIDSEHNAIFQCLAARCLCGRPPTPLRRIILTASGGPFLGRAREDLADVTIEQALNHPTWRMGPKITIDSATLMNKGFEVIETSHLFGEPVDKIEVVIHPQSAIHGMIEYHDGSMLAQMGVTDMYLPIANVLAWPDRLPNARFEPMDLAAIGRMTFEKPDLEAFPCLRLAYEAIRAGQTYPTVLNAANEVAVARFLAGEIRFLDISGLIEQALEEHRPAPDPDLAAIAEADAWARAWSRSRPTPTEV